MDDVHTTTLPDEPGTYILWFACDAPLHTVVGRLGAQTLEAGIYAYVGSAHGPGGLRARLSRHLRADKKPHWHIDAITTRVLIAAIWLRCSPEALECVWARHLADTFGTHIPVRGFGASDCACQTHLFAVAPERLQGLWHVLGKPEVVTRDTRFMF